MAREELNFTALRFVSAFRALNKVRKSCFSTKLREDWSDALDEFKVEVTDLVKDKNIPSMTCTLKIHVILGHVREYCEDEIAVRPDEPRGLGYVSTQALESMHSSFDKHLETFNPSWNNPDKLKDDLARAASTSSAKNLWPSDDGDQN